MGLYRSQLSAMIVVGPPFVVRATLLLAIIHPPMPYQLSLPFPSRDVPTTSPGPNRCDHQHRLLNLAFNKRAGSYARAAVVQRRLAAWLAGGVPPPARAGARGGGAGA